MIGQGFYVDFESPLWISMKQFPKTLASEIKGVSESLPAISELWNMSPHDEDFLPENFAFSQPRFYFETISLFLKVVVATKFQKLCKTVYWVENAGPNVLPQNIL